MARNWTASTLSKHLDGLGRLVGTAAMVAVAACSTASGGGGGSGTSAAAAGTPCNPTSQNQGCFNGVRMQCTADASTSLGGKWALSGPCGTNESCVEAVDPSSATKHIAQCKPNSGTGSDATTGADGTIGSDGTSGSDTTIGGDDATTTKDTGPVIGSCGDGFCNTGETAANCPADCGTANNCGNGTCDAGETKANCPADCGTTTKKCGNGTCDAGETTANCPADCPASGGTCGDLVCDSGEDATSCPIDCDPANACLNTNCGTEFKACLNDTKCLALLQCLQPCAANDQNCINACANTAGQNAVTLFQAVGTCYKNAGCSSTTTGTCGDGTCGSGETKANCPADCGGSTGGTNPCDASCGGQATIGCYCDAICMQNGDCCGDAAGTAATTCTGSTCADCNGGGTTTPVCGNGTCDTGETNASCPADCPSSGGTCTTYADVQSIFKNNCNGCHGHQFGTSCASASNYSAINSYVQSGQMPTNKTLSASDKAKIAAWAAAKNACTTASCP